MASSIEKLITRYFQQVWNEGKIEVLDEMIDSHYINHNPGIANPQPGPKGLKPIVLAIRQGFPDINYVIENMVICDNQVAVHTTMRGTHSGDFFGLAPTHKSVSVTQMQIERIHNNKIIEHWRVTDELTLMQQLGQIER